MAHKETTFFVKIDVTPTKFHSFGDAEVSKSRFVDALSEFKNILAREQKAVAWCFVKRFYGTPCRIM